MSPGPNAFHHSDFLDTCPSKCVHRVHVIWGNAQSLTDSLQRKGGPSLLGRQNEQSWEQHMHECTNICWATRKDRCPLWMSNKLGFKFQFSTALEGSFIPLHLGHLVCKMGIGSCLSGQSTAWRAPCSGCIPAQFPAHRGHFRRLLLNFSSSGNLTECVGGDKIEKTCTNTEAETQMGKKSWSLTIL